MSRSPRQESLTVTGILADAWRDGRIFVQVYEDPEETGVLVMAGFDPQTWDEPLGELDRGTRVRLHGVNAVARRVVVRMDWKWQLEKGPLWPREKGPPDEVGRGESEPAAHRETSPTTAPSVRESVPSFLVNILGCRARGA